jgi:hypothetical protein
MLLLLLTLVRLQFNPLLLLIIIFYLIKHQNPCTHPFNFNYVFEVVERMLQLPFLFSFEPWLAIGLVSNIEPKFTPLYKKWSAYIPTLKLGVCYLALQEVQT